MEISQAGNATPAERRLPMKIDVTEILSGRTHSLEFEYTENLQQENSQSHKQQSSA